MPGRGRQPLAVLAVLSAFSSCASPLSEPAGTTSSSSKGQGNASFFYGERTFHGGSVFGSGSQSVLGFTMARESSDLPVGFEVGGFWPPESADSANGLSQVRMWEVFLGIWKSIDTGSSLRPYFGGGGTGIHADLKGPTGREDDHTEGMYLHAGLLWNLAPNVVLSLDLRTVLLSRLEFSGISGSGDYTQLALGFGVQF